MHLFSFGCLVFFVSLLLVCDGHEISSVKNSLDLKYQTIIRQGLTGIIWEEDSFEHDLNQIHKKKLISSRCHQDIKYVFEGFSKLDSTSFALLDSSAKATAGILQGNVLSLGDYDSCLSITHDVNSHRSFQGMYCGIEVELDDATNKSSWGEVYTRHLPSLGAFHPKYGICFPSSCSVQDIENLVKTRITRYPMKLSTPKPYPLEFDTKITCDTKETNSFLYRLSNLTFGQKLSAFMIFSFFGLVNLCTFLALFNPNGLVAEFSILTSLKRMSTPRIYDTEVLGIEFVKTCLIFGGFYGHSVVYPEKVIAISSMQSPYLQARTFLSNWIFQPCNDGLLFAFAVFGGYTLYKGVASKIMNRSFNPIRALASRYFKYILLTSGVIFLEFLYPIIGDGPLWTPMAERTFQDCQNNWWRHYIMSGHTNAIRGCSIHLFMTSVDFRLFAYGLLILYILRKSMKLGIAFCVASFFVCNIMVYQETKHLDLPVMFGNPIDIRKAADFFYTVHFLISYYLPGYCVGILTALWIESGWRLYPPSFFKSYLHLNVVVVYAVVIIFLPGLHNIFHIIPQSMNGLFIVFLRNVHLLWFLLAAAFFSHFPWKELEEIIDKYRARSEAYSVATNGLTSSHVSTDEDASNDVKSKMVPTNLRSVPSFLPMWSQMLMNGFLKLIVSLHAVNMLCLRFHFTSSRATHSLRPYDILTRWNALTYMVVTAPFCFHLYFTAPLEAIYTKVFPRKDNEVKSKNQ